MNTNSHCHELLCTASTNITAVNRVELVFKNSPCCQITNVLTIFSNFSECSRDYFYPQKWKVADKQKTSVFKMFEYGGRQWRSLLTKSLYPFKTLQKYEAFGKVINLRPPDNFFSGVFISNDVSFFFALAYEWAVRDQVRQEKWSGFTW